MANRRGTILNIIRDWKERYPSIEIDEFQHLPGPLNPADLVTRNLYSAQDVGEGSLWQDDPDFLQIPRADWPLSRYFCSPSLIPDVKRNADFKTNNAKMIGISCNSPVLFVSEGTCDRKFSFLM